MPIGEIDLDEIHVDRTDAQKAGYCLNPPLGTAQFRVNFIKINLADRHFIG